MTKREAAIVTCYTNKLIGDIDEVYKYLNEITGFAVFTHQIQEVCEKYRERIKEDFVKIKVK